MLKRNENQSEVQIFFFKYMNNFEKENIMFSYLKKKKYYCDLKVTFCMFDLTKKGKGIHCNDYSLQCYKNKI
jgi:hypothetical protein